MSLFLKLFNTTAEYNTYTADTENFILPNVSLTVDNNTVHYNPSSPTPQTATLTCVYVPTGGGSGSGSGSGSGGNSTKLFSSEFIESIESMTIDGNEQSSIVNSYDFVDTSEHTVTLDLKDGVTSIENNAFSGCTRLTSINIPNNVTSIGNSAFYYCTSLTSIDIPNSVTNIGNNAFQNCSGLTSCTIGNGVTSIGNYVFYDCRSLTSIDIPNSVTSIGSYAFASTPWWYTYSADTSHHYDNIIYINDVAYKATSTSITTAAFKSGTVGIGGSAFSNCSGLTSIVIPDNVITIGSRAFYYCSNLTSCTIGSGVTSIGSGAFEYCRGLTSVTIGGGVTDIGYYAFSSCSSLTSIISNAATAPTIYSTTFQIIKSGGTLTVPSGSTGYDIWMQNANYYLGLYNWTKVEQ